jgi:hypothetical protein
VQLIKLKGILTMRLLKQLTLVTALSATTGVFALQSMDDAALASTTGQDGVTVLVSLLNNTLSIQQIALFDNGGYAGAQESGALTLGQTGIAGSTGFSLTTSNAPIKLVIDYSGGGAAGGTAGTSPLLNIAVQLPTTMNIVTGDISVQGANTSSAGAYTVNTNNVAKILDSMTIGLGGMSVNIQLGNPNQGAMVVASATVAGGLNIANFGLKGQPSTNGTLGVANTNLKSNGSGDLNLNSSIDLLDTAAVTSAVASSGATAGGVLMTLGNGTANSANYDAYMQGVTLGDGASRLGDMKLTGMDLTGAKVIISGH